MTKRKEQEFLELITAGNLPGLEELHKRNPHLMLQWRPEQSPRHSFLHVAVLEKHKEIVEYLLRQPKLDVNLGNDWEETALHMAARVGGDAAAIAKLLMNHSRINLNAEGLGGAPPIHKVVDVEILKVFLGNPRIDPNVAQSRGENLLMKLARSGEDGESCKMIKVLLQDDRVDVNLQDSEGKTALWFACNQFDLKMVQLILAYGKNLDTKKKANTAPKQDWSGTTAAEIARKPRSFDLYIAKPGSISVEWREEPEYMLNPNPTFSSAPHIADLIEEYERNPEAVRARLRKEL